jgi:DnaJ-class molecular chaperone
MLTSVVVNYYNILKIPKNATYQDISYAYLEQSRCYGPANRITPNAYAKKEYDNCCEAYNILSNPKSRAVYDKLLICENKLTDMTEKYMITKETSSILGVVSALTLTILGFQITYKIIKQTVIVSITVLEPCVTMLKYIYWSFV